jgi:hypothetical protein
MNAFTVLSTGHTSAYLKHYLEHWLLVPSCPLMACGWLPARALTPHESHQRVISFRVSILRDRRVVLYAGSRSSECHVSAWQHGRRPFPFGPAIQPLGRVCMTTPHPHLYSSLPIVTCSTGRCVRLAAYRLSFPLSTRAYQFHAEGRCCLSFTREVGVDVYGAWKYHLTHMDTQLSKINDLCHSSPVPRGTVSSERVAPCASSRPPTRAANSRDLLSIALGVESPSANIGGG